MIAYLFASVLLWVGVALTGYAIATPGLHLWQAMCGGLALGTYHALIWRAA